MAMDAREGGEATSRRKKEEILRDARWDAEVHQRRGWKGRDGKMQENEAGGMSPWGWRSESIVLGNIDFLVCGRE